MELTDMHWPVVASLDRATPVVLPIAALEQHGHHMPLFTDSMLLGEILRRVKASDVAESVLFAPLQWLGNSHHHLDMPGTISATPRLYLDHLAEGFLAHDFRRILFLNGHGGNMTPSQQAIFELRQKYRDRGDLLLTALTYWESTDPRESVPGLSQGAMGHACEWETSMMLCLHPEIVAPSYRNVPETSFGEGGAPGYRGWTTRDRSALGHIGCPSDASADKGEALLRVFAGGVADYLQRMIDWSGEPWNL